jgi:hypothetical protein
MPVVANEKAICSLKRNMAFLPRMFIGANITLNGLHISRLFSLQGSMGDMMPLLGLAFYYCIILIMVGDAKVSDTMCVFHEIDEKYAI